MTVRETVAPQAEDFEFIGPVASFDDAEGCSSGSRPNVGWQSGSPTSELANHAAETRPMEGLMTIG